MTQDSKRHIRKLNEGYFLFYGANMIKSVLLLRGEGCNLKATTVDD